MKEAERRIKLNANELANDDSSLMPELLHKSTLIEDSTLLEVGFFLFHRNFNDFYANDLKPFYFKNLVVSNSHTV